MTIVVFAAALHAGVYMPCNWLGMTRSGGAAQVTRRLECGQMTGKWCGHVHSASSALVQDSAHRPQDLRVCDSAPGDSLARPTTVRLFWGRRADPSALTRPRDTASTPACCIAKTKPSL